MNQLVSSVDSSTNDVTTYTYDIYGNLVNDGEYIYTYDSYFNRLYSVRNIETNESVYYEYYVDGLRKSKGNTYFIWLDGNMVYEFAGSDSNTYTYGHRLLYSEDYKYVLNAHGDVVSRLDSIGDELKRYKYDAFGNELNPSASDTNPFRYCAEYFDVESGQIYLRNRYYQPVTGRFSQLDHIKDGLNWYAYCANNPILYNDRTGCSFTATAVTVGGFLAKCVLPALGIGVAVQSCNNHINNSDINFSMPSSGSASTTTVPNVTTNPASTSVNGSKVKAESKETSTTSDIIVTAENVNDYKDIVIYRYNMPIPGTNQPRYETAKDLRNFVPTKRDYNSGTGLSFNTTAKPDSVYTTIGKVVETGMFYVQISAQNPNHVMIYPSNGDIYTWHNEGTNSEYTIKLRQVTTGYIPAT